MFEAKCLVVELELRMGTDKGLIMVLRVPASRNIVSWWLYTVCDDESRVGERRTT